MSLPGATPHKDESAGYTRAVLPFLSFGIVLCDSKKELVKRLSMADERGTFHEIPRLLSYCGCESLANVAH